MHWLLWGNEQHIQERAAASAYVFSILPEWSWGKDRCATCLREGSFSQSKLWGKERVRVSCLHNRFIERWTQSWGGKKKKGRIQSLQFDAGAAEQLVCINYTQNLKWKTAAFSPFVRLCRERPRIIVDEEEKFWLMRRLLVSDKMSNHGWSECISQKRCKRTCSTVAADGCTDQQVTAPVGQI